jgi:hypothetical protein
MVAEIPEAFTPTCALFVASGYIQEAVLTDYVLERPLAGEPVEAFVIPVTVDDVVANDLLADQQVCWERSVETLLARKDEIQGLAVASDESYEAFILYTKDGEILSLRSFVEDGGARLKLLLSQLSAQGTKTFRIQKVHPAEISAELLELLGFRPAGLHRLFAAKARSA